MIITEFSKCRLDIATTIGVYPLESNFSILMVSSAVVLY